MDFLIHTPLDFGFDFIDLRIQFLNEFDGVFEFQRFCGHNRTDRSSCSLTNKESRIFAVCPSEVL